MFGKILIANRGEIACRIIRTCRKMGVGTVAVYSSADRNARHVALADEAVRIGAAPSSESYLNPAAIVDAARQTGAEAVHPGFGFLSENADFAEACADAGIVFIGPPAEAIRQMGSKSTAKKIMAAAGVPVLAGDPDATQDDAALSAAADAAGYPVMVKPAAGGGGRGMRIVRAKGELGEALASARREAASAFGDDTLLIEKYLESPRHIEVQVFGDSTGEVIHLFERDCSVQRRHQKVIEEAPAPGLDADLRARLGATAVAAAKAVDYVGAGTVEFLLADDGGYWFMEMNTRLQVEHPVTELVTGIDLVEWQLRIAAGESLPLAQGDIRCEGHSIEARLYAEDPADEFRPGFGRLARLLLPDGEGVRIDSGVREGDEVTVFYDPMIAKIISYGADRDTAADTLSEALSRVRIAGPATNEAFLRAIVDHPEFRAGGFDTSFLARNMDDLVPPAAETPDDLLALAALAVLAEPPADDADLRSPWSTSGGWRLGAAAARRVTLIAGEQHHGFVARGEDGLERDGAFIACNGRWTSDTGFQAVIGGRGFEAEIVRDGTAVTVFAEGRRHVLTIDDPLAAGGAGGAEDGSLFARMPGVVVSVNVSAGDHVEAGTPLLMLEAMKVEHTIRAPADGTVVEVHYAEGERVTEGSELVSFEPD